MAERVTAISSPMLIVAGGLDRLVPWCERLHDLLPKSQYKVIEGAPHNVYYEAATQYNAAVDQFLATV
jgi:pimeloyl-ACP methyl ester carboxylesterase